MANYITMAMASGIASYITKSLAASEATPQLQIQLESKDDDEPGWGWS
jgi:hypothetical protein